MTFTCQMLSKLSSCDLPCPITAGKTVIDIVIDTNMCRKRSLHVYAMNIRNSYTMGCPPVRGDNPRALASGLSLVREGVSSR